MPLTKAPCILLNMSTDPLTSPMPVDSTQHDVVILFNDTLYYADGTSDGLKALNRETQTREAHAALTTTLSAMTENVSQLADAATLELISTVSARDRINYIHETNLINLWSEIVRASANIEARNGFDYLTACEKFSTVLLDFHTANNKAYSIEDLTNCASQLARQNPLRVTQQQGEIMMQLLYSFNGYHLALSKIKKEKRSATQKEHLKQLNQSQETQEANTLQKRQALIEKVLQTLPNFALLANDTPFNSNIDIEPNNQFPELFHSYPAYPGFCNALHQITTVLNHKTENTSQVRKLVKQIKQQALQLAKNATPKEMEKLTTVLTATHTALTAKTPESATALTQAGQALGKNSRWKFLGGATLVLSGFLLIAASLAVALVSFGALSPLSVAGVAIGANIMAGGIAVGVGATAMIGSSMLGASSFFTRQIQKEQIEKSVTQLSQYLSDVHLSKN